MTGCGCKAAEHDLSAKAPGQTLQPFIPMKTSDTGELRRSLTILHLALCMGCALFLGVTAFLWNDGAVPMMSGKPVQALSVMGLVSAVGLPVLAILLFRRRIRSLQPGMDVSELAAGVRQACIMHWALIEGALFFNVVVFMLQADVEHWAVAAGLLVLLVLRAPSERRLQRWMTGTA